VSIQRRGSSWRARYYGPDGRQRGKSFRLKSDAQRWLAEQRSFVVQGDWTDPVRGRSPSASTPRPGWIRGPIWLRRSISVR
jgi:hypothetical protein